MSQHDGPRKTGLTLGGVVDFVPAFRGGRVPLKQTLRQDRNVKVERRTSGPVSREVYVNNLVFRHDIRDLRAMCFGRRAGG